ncbi:MAG: hypothetical protein AAGA28_16170 [Pseudomonadota bacterium]
MRKPKGQNLAETDKPNADEKAQQRAEQPDARDPEEAVTKTETLIRSLIVEERRRVTPSLFPELAPAEQEQGSESPDEMLDDAAQAHQSLNRSVREILQAERHAVDDRRRRNRRGLLSRAVAGALGAFRRNGRRPDHDPDQRR